MSISFFVQSKEYIPQVEFIPRCKRSYFICIQLDGVPTLNSDGFADSELYQFNEALNGFTISNVKFCSRIVELSLISNMFYWRQMLVSIGLSSMICDQI